MSQKAFWGYVMRENSVKVKNIALAALMTAVIAVCSQLAIPMPSGMPVTLQTFAVALAGCFLGAKWGAASITVYILLGTVGVPVFSGFKGGAQALFGATGGFIFGFIAMAILCGLSAKKPAALKIPLGAAGLAVCHTAGVLQYSLVTGTPFTAAFLAVSLPFLLKDAVSLFLAAAAAGLMRRRLPAV